MISEREHIEIRQRLHECEQRLKHLERDHRTLMESREGSPADMSVIDWIAEARHALDRVEEHVRQMVMKEAEEEE